MQEAFRSGFDIHTATAAQVFGVEPEQVTPLMRRHAKAVNFGIVYGISEFSLSEDIGVTRKEARQYIDNYLAHYAGVRTYMHEIVEQAKRDGYVTTLFGRRRELPELKSSNFNIRSFGERVALNTPIQGTAADIIKLAMIRVDAALRKQKLKARRFAGARRADRRVPGQGSGAGQKNCDRRDGKRRAAEGPAAGGSEVRRELV